MNGLFGIGILAIIIGAIMLYFGVGGNVHANTDFGEYSGRLSAVAIVLGIVLMAFGVM